MPARRWENLILEALIEMAQMNEAWYTGLAEAVSPGMKRGALVPLILLHRAGPARVTVMAGALGLDRTTVTRHLDELESRGLIERTADPDDRRAVVVRLTVLAKRSLDKAFQDGRDSVRASLATWSKDERAEFGRLLYKFIFPDQLAVQYATRSAPSGVSRSAAIR